LASNVVIIITYKYIRTNIYKNIYANRYIYWTYIIYTYKMKCHVTIDVYWRKCFFHYHRSYNSSEVFRCHIVPKSLLIRSPDRGDCWTFLHHLSKVSANRRGVWRLENNQCHSSLQKVKDGGSRELQASQPHLCLWKGDGTICPGFFFISGIVSIDSPRGNHAWSA